MNERFQGVCLNFRDDIRERFYEALKQIDRHESRSRSFKGKATIRKKKDLRDAINIAMAAATSTQSGRETAYILITQTEAVLKLSRCLSPTTADDLFDSLLFQTHSLPPIRVMTPAQVYLARQLRKWNPDVEFTIAQIDRYTQSFADLASWMTQFLLDRKRERPFRLEEFAMTREFKVLEKAFENLRNAYGSLNSSLWFVERFRRAQMRIQDLQEQTLLGHDEDGPLGDLESTQAAKLMREAETLVDALHLAAEALERKTPLEYGSQISDGEHERILKLKVIVHSEADEDHLMSGEVYIAASENDRYFDSYALRWEATCTVDRFLIAMSAIFQPFTSNIKNHSSRRSLLSLSKEYRRDENSDGIIAIYTESGIFYTDLRTVVVSHGWRSLRIQGLRRSIFKHFLSSGKKFSPTDVPEIRKLRICSRYGDFVIDAQGSDYGSIPRITVISSVNLGREIGYLARATMCHPVSGKKLASHLDNAFKRMAFARPTHPVKPQMGEGSEFHAYR